MTVRGLAIIFERRKKYFIFLKNLEIYVARTNKVSSTTFNSSDSCSVVSGMSRRNSRNGGRFQVSGNRCAHSRNNPLFGHTKKTVRGMEKMYSNY